MFKIIIERECGCVRRSETINSQELASKDEALEKALGMINEMNSDFCQKHKFSLVEVENNFLIKMS